MKPRNRMPPSSPGETPSNPQPEPETPKTPSPQPDIFQGPTGRISESGVSYDWQGFFHYRLWLDPIRHPDLTIVRAMLVEWLQTRYGSAIRPTPNQVERDDYLHLNAIATKLMLDLDCEAVEVKTPDGLFAVEYQRWDQ